MHKHHIIPKHAGGTDESGNIQTLAVEEHAEAHRILWERLGNLRDKLAWKMLTGKTDEAETIRIELAKTGFRAFLTNKHAAETWKSNISQSLKGRKQSDETRLKRSNTLKALFANGTLYPTILPSSHYQHAALIGKEAASKGRQQSKIWHDAVRSQNSRQKKMLSSPKRTPITIDGILYQGLRDAARQLNIPYSRIRKKSTFISPPTSIVTQFFRQVNQIAHRLIHESFASHEQDAGPA